MPPPPDSASPDRDRRATIAGLRVAWRDIPEPGDGAPATAAYGLWTVRDADGLLDGMTQEEFERSDERMPYFGMIWPAGEALAELLLADPALADRRVLDLGCGLGICGLAAAARGAQVTFFDWEPRALTIVAASAERQGELAGRCSYVVGDWRTPPPLGSFDRILGADVLYERRNVGPVAQFLAGHLVPGGEAWLTDPSRPQARELPSLARAAGLELFPEETLPSPPGEPAIVVYRLRRPPAV